MKEKLKLLIETEIIQFLNSSVLEKYTSLLYMKEVIQNEDYYYDEHDLEEAGLSHLINEDDSSVLADYSDEMISFYLDKLDSLEYEVTEKFKVFAKKLEDKIIRLFDNPRYEISVYTEKSYTRSRYLNISILDQDEGIDFYMEIRFSDHPDKHFYGNRITLPYNASNTEVNNAISNLMEQYDIKQNELPEEYNKRMGFGGYVISGLTGLGIGYFAGKTAGISKGYKEAAKMMKDGGSVDLWRADYYTKDGNHIAHHAELPSNDESLAWREFEEFGHVKKDGDYIEWSKVMGTGGAVDYKEGGYAPLNSVDVIFQNPEYNYTTSVASTVTEESAREYFVGKRLNVGTYPEENLQEVIDINFYQGGKDSLLQKGIENQYQAKTVKQVWELWTEEQREHFLSDHYPHFDGEFSDRIDYKDYSWYDLPDKVKYVVSMHVREGQYKDGGAIDYGNGGSVYAFLEQTTNGIPFEENITSSHGAAFILYPQSNHTKEDIDQAKRELRDQRDVVSIRIADEDDQDYLYKSEVFRDPRTRKLKWYQIDQDDKLIRNERKAGTTPEEFVTKHVLPNVKKTEAAFKKQYGKSIYRMEDGGEADNPYRDTYWMLGRLQADNEYFLGWGYGNEKRLWAGSVSAQIDEMKRLFNSLPEDKKPEWLSMKDIEEYEVKMKNYDAKSVYEGEKDFADGGIPFGIYVPEIAHYTGLMQTSVADFISKHDINDQALAEHLRKGDLSHRMDFATAVSGKQDSQYVDFFVREFSNRHQSDVDYYNGGHIQKHRNIWIPKMTKHNLERLLSKSELTDDDKEDLLDFKYFIENQKSAAYEKGLMDAILVSQKGDHVLIPKNKFWITNINYRTKDFKSQYWVKQENNVESPDYYYGGDIQASSIKEQDILLDTDDEQWEVIKTDNAGAILQSKTDGEVLFLTWAELLPNTKEVIGEDGSIDYDRYFSASDIDEDGRMDSRNYPDILRNSGFKNSDNVNEFSIDTANNGRHVAVIGVKGVSITHYSPKHGRDMGTVTLNNARELVQYLDENRLFAWGGKTQKPTHQSDSDHYSFDMGGDVPRHEVIREQVRMKLVESIGLDQAITEINTTYILHPTRLIEQAVNADLLHIDEIDSKVVNSAIEESANIEETYTGSDEGIGSSDMAFFMRSFLNGAGLKTEFVGDSLQRLDEDGKVITIMNELPSSTVFKDGGFVPIGTSFKVGKTKYQVFGITGGDKPYKAYKNPDLVGKHIRHEGIEHFTLDEIREYTKSNLPHHAHLADGGDIEQLQTAHDQLIQHLELRGEQKGDRGHPRELEISKAWMNELLNQSKTNPEIAKEYYTWLKQGSTLRLRGLLEHVTYATSNLDKMQNSLAYHNAFAFMDSNRDINKPENPYLYDGGEVQQLGLSQIPTYTGDIDSENWYTPTDTTQMDAWVDENLTKVPDDPYITDNMKIKFLKGLYYRHNKMAAFSPAYKSIFGLGGVIIGGALGFASGYFVGKTRTAGKTKFRVEAQLTVDGSTEYINLSYPSFSDATEKFDQLKNSKKLNAVEFIQNNPDIKRGIRSDLKSKGLKGKELKEAFEKEFDKVLDEVKGRKYSVNKIWLHFDRGNKSEEIEHIDLS